ncbi:methyl-accepting chemotaxis protein [Pseudooceanicola sp. 200-1SW]|uniref:methyl-accepting chemotaxis protein n=1 Tax=Pseudooceanicola sp. 200-1SW TaxID=3425949 RepID=UPI003D7F5A5D
MGLSKIRIALRLPAAFFLIVALSLAVLVVFSYSSAKRTLIASGEEEMRQIAETRAAELATWADKLRTDLTLQAHNPLVYNALRSFHAAWQTMGPSAADQMRALYPEEAGAEILDPGDGSVYSRIHSRFHEHFSAVARRGAYEDVYLLNPAGTVVYSVTKGAEFGLAQADLPEDPMFVEAQQMLAERESDALRFLDFAPHSASGTPSAFVMAPVSHGANVTLGAIVFRLSAATIGTNLGAAGGLGETGHAFVIGADGAARTAAPEWVAGTIAPDSALARALGGETVLIEEPLAQMTREGMITAAAPAEVLGAQWLSLVSKAKSEILLPVSSFLSNTLLYGGIILVFAAIVGTALALSVTRPLRDLSHSIAAVSEEDYDTPVPHVDRGDELGTISRSLEELRGALSRSHAIQVESAFKSAALASTSAALMITDEDFTITYMNDAVRDMMRNQVEEFRKIQPEFDPDNLIGVNMDIFHAHPGQIRSLITQPDKLPFSTDIRVGEARIQIELNAVYGPDKSFAGLVVEWVDVTEERRRTSVLNAIDSGQIFVECNSAGTFRRLNDNFLTLTGCTSEDLLGRALTDRIRLDEGTETAGQGGDLMARLKQAEAVQGRFLITRPGRDDALVEGGLYPIIDSRGSTSGMALIGSDVTAAQQQLREAEARQKAMQLAQEGVVDALRIGMRDISNGDLTGRLSKPFAPEYEQLRTDFNDALENLTRAMGNIAQQTSQMHSETAEIVKAADDMSQRTERQAMTLQDTAASLDELTTNIAQTADGAARANQVVTEARARAEESGSVVDEAETAMAEISSSSKEIMKVISVIDDISFQTNLLALNAGVEAARAGEAGRGFAVVATEVRALAQRCANAAAEINQLITVSGQHVSRGVELVGVTGETLKKIVSSISEISDYIAEIAQAGKEQSIGLNQVNSAVNQIDHVTQQNAAMFEETTSASHQLAQRANNLAETIGHFRISGAPERARTPARESERSAASGRMGAARAPRASGGTAPARSGNLAVAARPSPSASDWEDF